MYVVTVEFEAKPEHREAFRAAMIANAKTSREAEPGCFQFDVCVDPTSGAIFLYEIYADRAAFDAHLASAHFKVFDSAVHDWVTRKEVKLYERVSP
jgi:quinol monooxygenase YgiN